MSLDPDVQAQVDDGRILPFVLIRFIIPDHDVGYHMGGRNLIWGDFLYKPNRFLDPGSFAGTLGNAVTRQTITFSDVPTDDADDAIAILETLDYLNAPVIITFLAANPETDEILGVLVSHLYEIDRVVYDKSAVDGTGERSVTVSIDLEPPGRSVRDQTCAKRSLDDQQFDNLATDTCFEHAATNDDIPEEWGQISQ